MQNKQDIIKIFGNFNGDSILKITRIHGASPNKLWVIETERNEKFVLRNCVRNNDLTWLNYIANTIDSLYNNGIPVSPMIKVRNRDTWTLFYKGSYWQTYNYLEGVHFKLGDFNHERAAVNSLSSMHGVSEIIKGPDNPNDGIENWLKFPDVMFSKLKISIEKSNHVINKKESLNFYHEIINEVFKTMDFSIYDSLSKVFTHGDFHCTNLVYTRDDKLIGIIDFDTAEVRPKIYDVSLSTFMLTRKKRGGFNLNEDSFIRFLKMYICRDENLLSEMNYFVVMLYLQFLPTSQYIDKISSDSEFLSWYINRSLTAIESVKTDVSKYILKFL